MVRFDPKTRIDAILKTLIPSVLLLPLGREEKIGKLVEFEERAYYFSLQCEYPIEEIKTKFDAAFLSLGWMVSYNECTLGACL